MRKILCLLGKHTIRDEDITTEITERRVISKTEFILTAESTAKCQYCKWQKEYTVDVPIKIKIETREPKK